MMLHHPTEINLAPNTPQLFSSERENTTERIITENDQFREYILPMKRANLKLKWTTRVLNQDGNYDTIENEITVEELKAIIIDNNQKNKTIQAILSQIKGFSFKLFVFYLLVILHYAVSIPISITVAYLLILDVIKLQKITSLKLDGLIKYVAPTCTHTHTTCAPHAHHTHTTYTHTQHAHTTHHTTHTLAHGCYFACRTPHWPYHHQRQSSLRSLAHPCGSLRRVLKRYFNLL